MGNLRRVFWGCAAALSLSLSLSGQTIDDLFDRLQKSFAARDLASYTSAFVPDLREREGAAASAFMNIWKMNEVLIHRSNLATEQEADTGLYLQVLYQNEFAAMLEKWHIWLQKTEDHWLIQKKKVTGNIISLFKIRIPSARVERAEFVEIRHEDIRVTFENAWVFYDNIPDMEIALLVIGKGRLHFSPSSETEKHQLELRYKKNFLDEALEHGYFRFSDTFFQSHITIKKASPDGTPPLSPAESSAAAALFKKYYPASFTIENSLTNDLLSFAPRGEQAVFELKGKKTGDLAYIYSPFSEDEIHLIKRESEQVINLYSPEKKGEEGLKSMFVSFGERFDVRRCDLEVDFQPDKLYLSARARVEVAAQIDAVDNLRFNFNPGFEILRIFDQEGRELFYAQDKPRELLYIYFVDSLAKGSVETVDIYYRGTLSPPGQTQDVVAAGQYNESLFLTPPPFDTYLYSQSAYWYPAPPEVDYFQASLKFSVPPGFLCVANGELVEQGTIDSIQRVSALEKVGNAVFRFETKFPIKYLSFIVGKFNKIAVGDTLGSPSIQGYASPEISVQRRGLLGEARAIVENYEKWFGAFPYGKLSVVQRLWPISGGHSPASFVVLNELPRTPDSPLIVNSNSPVDLSRRREYYIAHEIAHQWWGQALAWERYRDQWLSEGLAQFASAYYLKTKLGDRTYAAILKKFAQWTERKADCGPITLGSRLSYLDFDAYQAIVYDKAALALNMLLDMIGEETFFKGLRGFFEKYKYRSARTPNFIRSMEEAAGRDLQPFFKGWFDSHILPEVHVATDIQKQGDDFVLKIRVNQTRDVFVFPLWVEWQENDTAIRRKLDISAATQEFEIRTKIRPARIRINPDKFVPGDFH